MIKKYQANKGFTLIELMIVVAIIGIIASIALPAYQNSVQKAKRADAQGALLGLANALERYYTENNSYQGTSAAAIFSGTVPTDGGTTYYDLSISAPTTSTYTITAAGTGSMGGDKCGDLTYASTGVQDITNESSGVVASDCWR